MTDFVEPEFRKSRGIFGSMTVDGPKVEGRYNGKHARFDLVDKSLLGKNKHLGYIEGFDYAEEEMKGFRSQYAIRSKQGRSTNTSLILYDKDVYNQVKATMRGNH